MKYRLLILAVVLLFSTFAVSCSDANDNNNNSEITKSDASTETESEKEETTALIYNKPDVDFGGAEFTFMDYDTEEYFWQAATYSDINTDGENGEPINDAQYKRNLQVEEELNITLKTHPVSGVSRSNNAELRKYVLAGEDAFDAAFVFGTDVKNVLTEEKMLIDFYIINTMNTSSPWWDSNAVDSLTVGRELKVITGDISIFTSFAPMLLYFNKEVAADYNIDGLYNLVREGKWTHEKMLEYCNLVSANVNGDDIMDENDNYGIAVQGALLPDMMIAEGCRFSQKNNSGDLEIVFNNEHTIDAFNKCIEILNDTNTSIIANKYSSKYSNPFYEMHLPMFMNNQTLFNYNQLLLSFELRAMDSDYGLLPLPKYDEKQDDYYTSVSTSWMTLLCIPATNTNLDMTGYVLEAMGYYSQRYVTSEFIETTVRTKSLRDEDSAEMLDIILSNKVYDIVVIYNMGGLYTTIASLGSNYKTNFTSEYAAIENTVLTELAKFKENIK